jgi:hypothetical protein
MDFSLSVALCENVERKQNRKKKMLATTGSLLNDARKWRKSTACSSDVDHRRHTVGFAQRGLWFSAAV